MVSVLVLRSSFANFEFLISLVTFELLVSDFPCLGNHIFVMVTITFTFTLLSWHYAIQRCLVTTRNTMMIIFHFKCVYASCYPLLPFILDVFVHPIMFYRSLLTWLHHSSMYFLFIISSNIKLYVLLSNKISFKYSPFSPFGPMALLSLSKWACKTFINDILIFITSSLILRRSGRRSHILSYEEDCSFIEETNLKHNGWQLAIFGHHIYSIKLLRKSSVLI